MLQTHVPVTFSVILFILMRFCFDSRQESFQINAFLMKTLGILVWTEGLQALKCMRFQMKMHLV